MEAWEQHGPERGGQEPMSTNPAQLLIAVVLVSQRGKLRNK